MKKLTIYDIATLAGVSKSTVSRFLNGGYVSEKNREKIEKIVEEHNFKRSDSAVSLRTKANQTVGIIVPRIDSYASSNVVKGVLNVINRLDYNAEIITSDLDFDKELAAYQKLKERNVKGIIAIATNMSDDYEQVLTSLGLPIVIFGQECEQVSCVFHDVTHAVAEFCDALFPANYENQPVVLFGPDSSDKMLSSTIDTFHESLTQRGLTVHHVNSDFNWQSSYDQAAEVLSTSSHIVCLTDNIAYGVYKYAHENGLIVGKDIHISGIGGYDTSSILTPELSTIAYPYQHAGEEAVRLLLDDNSVTKLKLGYSIQKTNSFSA